MAPTRPSAIGKGATGGDAGFTLTELLVVLAIIGLLVVAAPALLKIALPATQSLAAARTLASDLRLARGLAIARGQSMPVAFDTEHQNYRTPDGVVHLLPNHVRFAFASTAPHEIVFRPDGGASGAVILVGERPAQHRVTADWLTGRIAIDE